MADRVNSSGKRSAKPPSKANLNDTEELALQVLADPENAGVNPRDLAKIMGISPRYFRELRSRKAFQRELHELLKRRLMGHLPVIMDVLVKSAMLLGRDGHHDRKLFFALAGVTTDATHPDSKREQAKQAGDMVARAIRRARSVSAAPMIDGSAIDVPITLDEEQDEESLEAV